MTGNELRTLRRRLGLTQKVLAELLGLRGDHVKGTVRQWEAERRPISGPADRLLRAAARFPAVRRWLERGAP